LKMAAEGEKLDPDERPSEAIDRHVVVMVMEEAVGTTQRKVFKIVRTDAGGFFGLTEWIVDGPVLRSFCWPVVAEAADC